MGKYRVDRNFLLEGGIEISVADTSKFAFSQIKTSDNIKTRVGIAY